MQRARRDRVALVVVTPRFATLCAQHLYRIEEEEFWETQEVAGRVRFVTFPRLQKMAAGGAVRLVDDWRDIVERSHAWGDGDVRNSERVPLRRSNRIGGKNRDYVGGRGG